MSGWRLFLITPTATARRRLRCFTFTDDHKCAASAYGCNAIVTIDDVVPKPIDPEGIERSAMATDFANDPRWPTVCDACKQPFPTERVLDVSRMGPELTHCQVWDDRYYEGFLDGRRYTLREPGIPPGAVYHRDYLDDSYPAPDGKCWAIFLPDGVDWMPSGPSKNSNTPWAMSGPIPLGMTASPSIASPGYHGWLQAGILTPDCEGRSFPQHPFTA